MADSEGDGRSFRLTVTALTQREATALAELIRELGPEHVSVYNVAENKAAAAVLRYFTSNNFVGGVHWSTVADEVGPQIDLLPVSIYTIMTELRRAGKLTSPRRGYFALTSNNGADNG